MNVLAQSCCSGGVPISNSLGLSPGSKGDIQFSTGYDLNLLKTLKNEAQKLDDDARSRLTHTVIAQIGYVFSEKWSTELFFSWIKQERIINQFQNTDKTTTEGFGDAAILIKYKLLGNEGNGSNLFVGSGIKAPTGSSDEKSTFGIPLNADLQPGSGAWDAIIWTQYSRNLMLRPSATFSTGATISFKGTNKHYLEIQEYKFGNELVAFAGISDQWVAGKIFLLPSL